ncbi:MAG: biopolymer transporter ExbD [Elusimicrobiota bacterium]
MTASTNGGDEQPITAINVTPLVDIILVLLIIFMATAPLIHRRSIKVDVPQAVHQERATVESVPVVYNNRREIFLSGKKVTRSELASELRHQAAGPGDTHVTMSADQAIAYGEIVGLLDVIRGAGVRKIGLEVRAR